MKKEAEISALHISQFRALASLWYVHLGHTRSNVEASVGLLQGIVVAADAAKGKLDDGASDTLLVEHIEVAVKVDFEDPVK